MNYPVDFINKIINGDCIEVLGSIPDKSIDMILCDLPYGRPEDRWGSVVSLSQLWEQYARIIKDTAPILLLGDNKFTVKVISSNEAMYQYSLVWDTVIPDSYYNTDPKVAITHRDIMVFYKEYPLCNNLKSNSIISYKRKDIDKVCYAEGSLELFEYLINLYSNENDVVLDNCIGCGTLAVACKNTNRQFIGIDIIKDYCEIAESRIDLKFNKENV